MRFDPCSQQHRIYAEPCWLLVHYRARPSPSSPFSNNAPLPETLLAIRRFTSAPMNPRVEVRVWTSNPMHKWILLPFQLEDKSKFVGYRFDHGRVFVVSSELLRLTKWDADPFCNWDIHISEYIFNKFRFYVDFFLSVFEILKICRN